MLRSIGGVHERLSERDAEVDVVTASSPLPTVVHRWSLQLPIDVTRTVSEVAIATSRCHRMDDSGCRNSVQERRLLRSCNISDRNYEHQSINGTPSVRIKVIIAINASN